ncbi:ATP-binding protein, partial [Streptomyces sp. NTH33]
RTVLPTSAPGPGGENRADAPALPRRPRRTGSFRPLAERQQAPATAATPGLAAAFRSGVQAGSTGGAPPAPSEPPRP